MRASKLLVGVGNVLRHDDGVGVRAAEWIGRFSLPPDVEVYDAGTMGFEAATILERRQLVVVVDAIDAGAKPGTLFHLAPEQLGPHARFSRGTAAATTAHSSAAPLGSVPGEPTHSTSVMDASILSLHDLHLLDALEETRLFGTAPVDVVILAIQVGDVSMGIGLSPPVEAALRRLVPLATMTLGLPAECIKVTMDGTSIWESLPSPKRSLA